MVDEKIGELVEITVHGRQNVGFSIFKLQRFKRDSCFNRIRFQIEFAIAIQKKDLFNTEEILPLNNEQLVPFVDQFKIE